MALKMMMSSRMAARPAVTAARPAPALRGPIKPVSTRRANVAVRSWNQEEEVEEVEVREEVREWPNPNFVSEVIAAFPDQGLASPEEARVSSVGKGLSGGARQDGLASKATGPSRGSTRSRRQLQLHSSGERRERRPGSRARPGGVRCGPGWAGLVSTRARIWWWPRVHY